MRYTTLVFTFMLAVFLSVASPAPFQSPQETPAKPLYGPMGNEAALIGSITVNGKVPEPLVIDMSADPVCMQLNQPRAHTDVLLTNDQGLLNAFIYVKSGEPLNTYRFEVPESEVILEHKNCHYSPHVLGVRAGQRLSIVNSDPTVHNTHPTPRINVEWNTSHAVGSPPLVKKIDRPEQFIPFKDNQHPWEKAYVGVFDHPFFAVSDQFGNYEIRGLPMGTYKLVAWHEILGEQELEITLGAGESRRIDFTFDVPVKPGSRME